MRLHFFTVFFFLFFSFWIHARIENKPKCCDGIPFEMEWLVAHHIGFALQIKIDSKFWWFSTNWTAHRHKRSIQMNCNRFHLLFKRPEYLDSFAESDRKCRTTYQIFNSLSHHFRPNSYFWTCFPANYGILIAVMLLCLCLQVNNACV